MSIKELSFREERFTSGHRLCAGCGATIIVRQVLMATDKPVVVCCPTGCLEVSTTIYPSTAWEVPYIHNAFENAAATLSGVESAYRVLMRRGKMDRRDIRFVAFGGDGGTYDIGLQALSGVFERGHRMVYVCYDNQAYMNCLSTSCLIMTENGLKKITEVKEGDKIYAFDQKTHQLVLRRCTGVFDNGIREVYGVETLHHSIKATANHPFLVLKRNGRGRRDSFVWKTLAEIKVGDEVVVLKNLENKYFDTEKIKNIRLAGCEPTLDLRVEDEHNFIADGIVVHNTGIQRSSATPLGAWTTTSPVGKVIPGKTQNRKDLTACVAAHNIPYVAQASPSHWRDLVTKAEKAFNAEGPAFLNILAPCPRGWRYPTNQTIRMARLAVETCFWPLYEVENGNWRLTHKPKEKKPLVEWLKPQGRFKHLFKPENRHVMEEFQAKVDEDWNNLLKRCQIE